MWLNQLDIFSSILYVCKRSPVRALFLTQRKKIGFERSSHRDLNFENKIFDPKILIFFGQFPNK